MVVPPNDRVRRRQGATQLTHHPRKERKNTNTLAKSTLHCGTYILILYIINILNEIVILLLYLYKYS